MGNDEHIVSGKELISLYGNTFYWVTTEDESDNFFQSSKHFTTANCLPHFMKNAYTHIKEISIPEDAIITIKNDAYVADKLYYDNKIPMSSFIKWGNENYCIKAVELNGTTLKYIKKQTEKICKIAILNQPLSLEYVINQTADLCELAVSIDGKALQFVETKFKSLSIMKSAIYQNGLALQFVPERERNYELCEIALRQNAYALKYVINQTIRLCEIAINQNPFSLQYLNDKIKKNLYI